MQKSGRQIWRCHQTDEFVVDMYFLHELEKLWESSIVPHNRFIEWEGGRNFEFEKFCYSWKWDFFFVRFPS